jgi:hypothetical protein
LKVHQVGSDDVVTIKGWYNDPEQQIEQFRTADGAVLSGSDVQRLVDAMAAFDPPVAGELSLNELEQQQLQSVIAATWQAA